METEAEFVILLNLRSQTKSFTGGVYSTEKEKKNCLHKALNVHLSPRDVNCFVDQQMIIKKLLKSEKNYPKQRKVTGLCLFLLMPFISMYTSAHCMPMSEITDGLCVC